MTHEPWEIKLWYPGKAQQQMILNYLKDKLAKEEKYSRLNNKKLVGKFIPNSLPIYFSLNDHELA